MAADGEALRQLGAGEALIAEGDPGRAVYELRSGTLDVVRGGVLVARVADAGALFGEMSVLLDRPASASVVARTPAVVVEVPDAAARLTSDPAFALRIARLLAHRLDTVNGYLADLRRQYADHEGGLGMIGDVLAQLSRAPVTRVEPGSERELESPY